MTAAQHIQPIHHTPYCVHHTSAQQKPQLLSFVILSFPSSLWPRATLTGYHSPASHYAYPNDHQCPQSLGAGAATLRTNWWAPRAVAYILEPQMLARWVCDVEFEFAMSASWWDAWGGCALFPSLPYSRLLAARWSEVDCIFLHCSPFTIWSNGHQCAYTLLNSPLQSMPYYARISLSPTDTSTPYPCLPLA